jgi:RNA 3'-terminal phosphate cyclase (ATP)
MLIIDGNEGEGGGQMLRTSLALAALTGKPFRMKNIRARRRNPGLAPQHLAGVRAAAQVCAAEVKGDALRSEEIRFIPGAAPQAGDYVFDVSKLAETPSAGAITLLMQSILLPLAFAEGESTVTLRGGTNVLWSPPIHYVEWVLLPTLARMGLEAALAIDTLGWYPKGGGEVHLWLAGNADLTGVDLNGRGAIEDVFGVGVASSLPAHIPDRMAKRANNLLKGHGLPRHIRAERTSARSTGAATIAVIQFEHALAGFSVIGKKGTPSEEVAAACIEQVVAHERQPFALDEHLPDQLLPFMMLAEGQSVMGTSRITNHTLTNIAVSGTFLERSVTVEGSLDEPGLLYVRP